MGVKENQVLIFSDYKFVEILDSCSIDKKVVTLLASRELWVGWDKLT